MSQQKILLVDDDRSLLDSVRRNLCFDYDLTTAECGPDALGIIESGETFPVVVTDMRMPEMDGVRFIEEARPLLPDTSFIMLTGNQDLETAIRAVNEGNVFRYLNKPCETDAIRTAIEAGLRQFELEQSEKVLLNRTCAGAVCMLMDVLESNQPMTGARLASLSETVNMFRTEAGIGARWEYTLASRLALVGFVCLDDEEVNRFFATAPREPAWREMLQRAIGMGSRMIKRIPRLEIVGEMVEQMASSTGANCQSDPQTEEEIVQTGADLLFVSVLWDAMRGQGLSAGQALIEAQSLLPDLAEGFTGAFQKLPSNDSAPAPVEIPARKLKPGMVLHSDVCSNGGSILLRAGRRLTEVVIEKIRDRDESFCDLRPILVVDQSADAKQPAGV